MNRMPMKRILIADDHVTVREGLRAILNARIGWEVVAEACNGREAVAAAIKTRPDVTILDQNMPPLTGLDAAKRIKEALPASEVVLFTSYATAGLALNAFRAGALACVSKSEPNKTLLAAVESSMAHKPFSSGMYAIKQEGSATAERDATQKLSAREQEIAVLVAQGYTNKGISAILNLSIKTTETHRAAVMRKLAIKSTAGIVKFVVRNELLVA